MLVSGTYDVLSYILIHLAFQVNGARHNPSRPANQLAKLIDNTIRNQITFTNYQRSQICKGGNICKIKPEVWFAKLLFKSWSNALVHNIRLALGI
ncbi:hypothetical protein YC2023_020206 [Brassica napus]